MTEKRQAVSEGQVEKFLKDNAKIAMRNLSFYQNTLAVQTYGYTKNIGIYEKLSKPNHIRFEGRQGEFPYHLKLTANHSTGVCYWFHLKVPTLWSLVCLKRSWNHLHCRKETMPSSKALFALAHQHPDFLLLLIWTRYLFTKNTRKHRIYCHNEVLSDLFSLQRIEGKAFLSPGLALNKTPRNVRPISY